MIDKRGANVTQGQVIMAQWSLPRDHPDYLKLQVLNRILGGSFESLPGS